MGNHSDTGELLEEANTLSVTESDVTLDAALVDEFGDAISLDESPDEVQLSNPTKLKDSGGRDADLVTICDYSGSD